MKSLACIFGRHRWTTHLEHGDEYNACSRCGKMPQDPPTPDMYTGLGNEATGQASGTS